MKRLGLSARLAFAALVLAGMLLQSSVPLGAEQIRKEAQARQYAHYRVPVVADWSHRHVLFPQSQNYWAMARFQREPRFMNTWMLRRPRYGYPVFRHGPVNTANNNGSQRDWNVPLGTVTYEPIIDFNYTISTQSGHGSLNTSDRGGGSFLATVGSLTNTAGADLGTYVLYPGGPGATGSGLNSFNFDNLVAYTTNPPLDTNGLLFSTGTTAATDTYEINIWGNSANNYSYYDSSATQVYGAQITAAGTFTNNFAPGGGQTFPTKYNFDVTAAPSCANDYVVMGIPAIPVSGGQANIVAYNNLYRGTGGLCGTGTASVLFAYAVGSGEVPASISLSRDGSVLWFTENLLSGSSYFHALTWSSGAGNGTSATAAAVPGTGNSAVDQSVLLSPDGGTTTQSSTTAPFVVYALAEASDVAYVTTYSWSGAGTGSGYLYKIANIFGGSAPTIVWSAAINAVPSAPVYDTVTNRIFFTDSNGRIDYVTDNGSSPSAVTYSSVLASGTISENPVVVDSTNGYVYATFNSNGTNAIVVQAPTSLASSVSVAVGTASTYYAGPYGVEFNNAWYTGVGTPLMYVVGTGSGAQPTLYSIGFNGSGVMNTTVTRSAALVSATGADASPPTEFYNTTLNKDYLFVGVTNHCVATRSGGTAGCVMALDITGGFPTIGRNTTALAATGGTTGFVIDNVSSSGQASSIYYATKTGGTLVKATQSALQ